jgi:colanic acid/amylovoran biosynthesis protein
MNYTIIVGASIDNLGAESMTCIAIKKAKRIEPDGQIVLASSDRRGMQSLIKYRVCSYQFPTNLQCHEKAIIGKMLQLKLGDTADYYYKEILPDTKLIIDISGYAFTTKFGLESVYSYLNRIYIASCYKIPYIACSQSFGPVDINDIKNKICCNYLMHKLLSYPQIIESREKEGVDFLKRYTKKNVKLKPDMVLCYKPEINYSVLRKKIYVDKKTQKTKRFKIAIIPNEKILTKTKNGDAYINILGRFIELFLKNEIEVKIIIHCKLDYTLGRIIADNYKDKVEMIDCTEQGSSMFDTIIKEYSFIIASRYHAIVHAYRHYIPAIVLGWENKYNELLVSINQFEYLIDCREDIEPMYAESIAMKMLNNYETEKNIIKNSLTRIRELYGECEKDY